MFPNQTASDMTGLPAKKKPTRRGRKPSGKPGADHLSKLQAAHGAGEYDMAANHALNYAKAAKSHAKATVAPDMGMGGEPDADDSQDSGNWIQGAIKHPGALHAEMGIPQGQTIPPKKLNAAVNSQNPLLAKRAQLAKTLKGMRKK